MNNNSQEEHASGTHSLIIGSPVGDNDAQDHVKGSEESKYNRVIAKYTENEQNFLSDVEKYIVFEALDSGEEGARQTTEADLTDEKRN